MNQQTSLDLVQSNGSYFAAALAFSVLAQSLHVLIFKFPGDN